MRKVNKQNKNIEEKKSIKPIISTTFHFKTLGQRKLKTNAFFKPRPDKKKEGN